MGSKGPTQNRRNIASALRQTKDLLQSGAPGRVEIEDTSGGRRVSSRRRTLDKQVSQPAELPKSWINIPSPERLAKNRPSITLFETRTRQARKDIPAK